MARNEIISQDFIDLAVNEIEATYGHRVRVNRKTLHKFGRNTNVGTSEVPVTDDGIVVVRPDTNTITHFSSSNAADTQTLRVEGMTIDSGVLTFSVQNITLNGQTKTALATPLARVTRIANVAVPSTATLGNVYIYQDGTVTGGVPDNLATVGNIMPSEEQSTMFAGTSVAYNNYLVLTEWFCYLNKKTAASADIRFKVGQVGGVQRAVDVGAVSNYSGFDRALTPFLIVPPNSDMNILASASTTGVDISAGFSGFFVDIVS